MSPKNKIIDSPDAQEREPKFVGGARNEFGTRTLRRIECNRCKKSDMVAYMPKERSRALCNACAKELLDIYEVGAQLPKEMVDRACDQCARIFPLNKKIDEEVVFCPDCFRGFATWQGDKDLDPNARSRGESRKSGTLLRRKFENDPK